MNIDVLIKQNKVLRLLIFISIFPLFTFGQSAFPLNKDEKTKVFCQAITEYIKASNKI